MTMESTGAVGTGTSVPRAVPAEASAPTADAASPPADGTEAASRETLRPTAVPAPRAVVRGRTGPPPGRRQAAALVAADLCAAGLAALLAGGSAAAVLHLAPMLLTLLALHQQGGLYRCGPACAALEELPRVLWRAVLAWCAATTAVAVARPDLTLGWPQLPALTALHVLLAVALRGSVHVLHRSHRRRRPRSTLVLGGRETARRIAAVLHEHPEYGMWPVGLITPPGELHESARPAGEGPANADRARTGLPLPELSAVEDVTRAVIQNAVTEAVVTRPVQADKQTEALVQHFRILGCTVWVVDGEAAPGRTTWQTTEAGHVWGFPCLRLDPPPARTGARLVKRAGDSVAALLALLAAAPLLALCALAVRVCDGPGVLFRQERIGVHGQPFVMLKFRTLRPTDAHESATRWNVAGDRRMSRIGHFLRRTSLDELPQLWNVLRGDMSLVGPRPERPYFVQQFSAAYPGYAARDRMPAGITGLAQVHGLRGDTSIEDRARFDNHYIETWSLWEDVRILLRTAGSVFRLGGS
ncbi:exopolysaccharide biosynthesis polyprenyl glycosylphosphotransferase [Streptomyces sp. TR06-5]|uniref:exopolysaccharide biosynthesis polyprenyl glycosylphosphotransferase n=1 Tax=unclassified Streptomyces TaxID=2593676 RepID=UPI0039A0A296